MRNRLSILFLILIVGCTSIYDFDLERAQGRKLVVNGYITDEIRSHVVNLSYLSGYTDSGIFDPDWEDNAQVSIMDDEGNTIELSNIGDGDYETPPWRAAEGRSYKLLITSEGRQYESTMSALPESLVHARLDYGVDSKQQLIRDPVLGELYQTVEGVQVIAEIEKSDEGAYYKWNLSNYFRYHSPLGPIEDTCYVKDFDKSLVYVLDDKAANTNQPQVYNFDLEFIPNTINFRWDFCVEATAFSISKEAFDFWEAVQSQTTNVGSLFDPAPYTIVGNVRNATTGDAALGYFGVHRESLQRIFFNASELPLNRIDDQLVCVPGHDDQGSICIECSVHPGEYVVKTKPRWWRRQN